MPPRNTWRRVGNIPPTSVTGKTSTSASEAVQPGSTKFRCKPKKTSVQLKNRKNTWVRGALSGDSKEAVKGIKPAANLRRKASSWVRKPPLQNPGSPILSGGNGDATETVANKPASEPNVPSTVLQERYVRQRSNKLLLKPGGVTNVGEVPRQHTSKGSAQSLSLHVLRAGRLMDASQRGGGSSGGGGTRAPGSEEGRCTGQDRAVLRQVSVRGDSAEVYRKNSGGYSLTREGVGREPGATKMTLTNSGQLAQSHAVGLAAQKAVAARGSVEQGARSSRSQHAEDSGGGSGDGRVLNALGRVKSNREYLRTRRGLSLLSCERGSGGSGSSLVSAGAGSRLALTASASVRKSESSQRRVTTSERTEQSLARASKEGNIWKRSESESPAFPSRSSATVTTSPCVNRLCGLFIRTGKCPRQFESGTTRCTRRHDPDKVAVCTRWLAGSCDDQDCPLTHRSIPARMPVCSYFLAGTCANPDCPYLHVNVDPTAPVCQSFLKGYCSRGLQCRMRHTLVCPALAKGTCPNPIACRFHHPKRGRGVKRQRGTDEGDDPFCEPCDE